MIGPRDIVGLFRTSLRARVALLMLAIFLAISLPAWWAFDRLVEDTTIRLGQLFAEKQILFDRSRGLETLLREASLAETLSRSPAILEWATDEADPEKRARGLAELERYRTSFRDGSYFFVADGTGSYYFNDRDNSYAGNQLRYRVDPDNPRDGWYFATLAGHDGCQLNVDHDDKLIVTKVWINCKVLADGRPVGVVGTGIDLDGFIREVVDVRQEGVESIFIDRSGAIQAHRDPGQIDYQSITKELTSKKTIFNLLDSAEDRNTIAAMMERVAADSDRVEAAFIRIGGKKVLAGIGYLGEIGWFNLTLMDIDKIIDHGLFRPIAALLGLILVAAIVLATVLFQRHVLDRLATLEVWARRVRAGDYGDMHPPAADDEIGRLTAAFGEMARAVGDHTQRLESMVQSRTEELERLAHVDPLTGVANRRGFLRAVAAGRERAMQEGRRLGILLVDLDLFKPVNDRYGHRAGDLVLTEISVRLSGCLGAGDLVARWGGDEFILLVELDRDGALRQTAETVRHALSDGPYRLEDGTRVTLSASIGACLLDDHSSIDTVIARADAALYAAKLAGRNQTALYRPGMSAAGEAAAS